MKTEVISPKMKQIEIVANGKSYRFEAFSWDGGHSWCSNPKATVAFFRRRRAVLDTRLTSAELRRIDRLDGDVDDVGIESPGDFEKKRQYMRAYFRRYRGAHEERKARVQKTHCIRGHELTPENVRIYEGSRHCKKCQQARMAAHQQKMKTLPCTEKRQRLQSNCSKREIRDVA